jgi:hypothetical protein
LSRDRQPALRTVLQVTVKVLNSVEGRPVCSTVRENAVKPQVAVLTVGGEVGYQEENFVND